VSRYKIYLSRRADKFLSEHVEQLRIIDSLVGKGSRVVPNEVSLPKGYRLIIGENTFVSI